MESRVRSLQALRFLAALAVVWDHASLTFGHKHFTGGAFGVDVFFVLSGFVISHAARHKPAGFLRHRLTRIFPPFWLWAIPWVVMGVAAWGLDWRKLVTTVTLWPALDRPSFPYLELGWTLSFELLFYTAVWAYLRGVRARWLVLGYAGCFVLGLGTPIPLFRYLGSPLVIEFALGVGAFWIGRRSLWLGVACISAAAWFLVQTGNGAGVPNAAFASGVGLARIALWAVPAFLLVLGFAQLPMNAAMWRHLVWLGDASFSLYLSHLLVIKVLYEGVSHDVPRPVAVLVCIAVSALAYRYVERPLLAWSRRAWPSRETRVTVIDATDALALLR